VQGRDNTHLGASGQAKPLGMLIIRIWNDFNNNSSRYGREILVLPIRECENTPDFTGSGLLS
jgi:hypothetical protein